MALKGDLTTSESAVKELRALVDELDEINGRLEGIEFEMAELKELIKKNGLDSEENAKAISDLQRVKVSNYTQLQYEDTNQSGKQQHSFELRRIRTTFKINVNEFADAKVSFDLAAGDEDTDAELKDAILTYKTGDSTKLVAGQFSNKMGYEIGRSSSKREFPERAAYNKAVFGGERIRGAYLEHAAEGGATFYAGLANGLSVGDKEETAVKGSGVAGRMAGFAGVRFDQDNGSSYGLSYWNGKRPSNNSGGPEVTRHFLYGDAYVPFEGGLYVRAEGMVGKDRTSLNSNAGAVDVNGWQIQLGLDMDDESSIFARYVEWDKDTDVDDNTQKSYGLGYRYTLSKGAMITATYEVFEDPTKSQSLWNAVTIRYQFKF